MKDVNGFSIMKITGNLGAGTAISVHDTLADADKVIAETLAVPVYQVEVFDCPGCLELTKRMVKMEKKVKLFELRLRKIEGRTGVVESSVNTSESFEQRVSSYLISIYHTHVPAEYPVLVYLSSLCSKPVIGRVVSLLG